MCLRVDFILIEVPLAHRRVKVVVFVHHCIFPSLLFLKSVTLVTFTVSGGNIEPGGPNEVMYKSILRVYTLVPMRCCLCILLYISSKVVPMRWCVRVRVCTLVLMRWCRYAGTTNAPRCLLLDGHFKARLHLHAREPDCCCSYSQLTHRRLSTAGQSCEMSNYSKICKYFWFYSFELFSMHLLNVW